MQARVCIVEIEFISSIEDHARTIDLLKRKVNRPHQLAKHTARTVSLVVETDERPDTLFERLTEVFDIDDVENAWCMEVVDASGFHGRLNPFTTAVKAAMANVRQRNNTQNMPQRQSGAENFPGLSVAQAKKRAPVEVAVKRRRSWKSTG